MANGNKIYFKNMFVEGSDYEELSQMHSPKKMLQIIGKKSEYGARPIIEKRGLHDCQYREEVKFEESLKMGNKKNLAVLATGSGKTYLACLASYRLLNYTPTKRILFLVDRNNLARQTESEFSVFDRTEGQQKMGNLYTINRLKKEEDIKGDIVISTIQKLFCVLTGQVISDSDEDAEDEKAKEDEEKNSKTVIELGNDLKLPPDYLVIVSDYTKGIYHDKWIGGVLHYTGMGKNGDQNINWAQNATLAACGRNGVDVHLFEVMDAGEYIYCGRIELVDKPYTEEQPGEDGVPRKVWMFPIRPVPDNDVKKQAMFVFKDMEDFKNRGKDVDTQYMKMIASKKKGSSKPAYVPPVIPKSEPKPPVVIPVDIVGKHVKHKAFGVGTITAIEGTSIAVEFDKVGLKRMGYEFCMEKKMLEFI